VDDADDELVDEPLPHVSLPVVLPVPTMGNLDTIDTIVQQSVMTPAGRESLVSFIHEEKYLYKLVEIFHECEDMEDLEGLHRLSSIMKTLSTLLSKVANAVLINDVVIIEPIIRDDLIFGVAGILECILPPSPSCNAPPFIPLPNFLSLPFVPSLLL